MGQAFRKIRDKRLYERDWKGTNFESYCHQRWRLGRRQVNNIIKASSACLLVLKKMGNRLPNFSATVWILLGEYLFNETELVDAASDLAARFTEGATVSQAKEFLAEREAEKELKSTPGPSTPSPAKEDPEEEKRRRSLAEYDEAHRLEREEELRKMEREWLHMEKDGIGIDIDEQGLAALKEDFNQVWERQFLKKHGHTFPGHLLIEVALKVLIDKHEKLTQQMKQYKEQDKS
jgi:hypothetical protein